MDINQKLTFEWVDEKNKKTSWALPAQLLTGVSTGCPFGFLPALGQRMIGMVLWNGRLAPAIDATAVLGETYIQRINDLKNEERLVFLFFSGKKIGLPDLEEVALVLPVSIKPVSVSAETSKKYKDLDIGFLVSGSQEIKREAA